MGTLRIRTFLLLCLCFFLMLPWTFYLAVYAMENQTIRFATSRTFNETITSRINEMIAVIDANTDRWGQPDWQNELQAKLRQSELDAVLMSASGEKLFKSSAENGGAFKSAERYSIIKDGVIAGTVVLYVPKASALPVHALVAGILLALFVIAMQMRRLLLKPLEGLSAAARQVAAGDDEVRLPATRITEIAEVRDGFDVMLKGLRQSGLKQAELEEERRFVIAALAHDLRTPLFALRGYLDGLEQGIARTPEKMSQYLSVCKDKSAQLDRLVEELFAYAKLEYVEPETAGVSVDIATILRKSIDSVNPQIHRKRISITDRLAGECFISGDADLLERAFNNLLDNAVRHTPEGGEISIHCYCGKGRTHFAIRDTGQGFSPDELQRVFEPLYRGEDSRNRSTGGTGLGLTISQRIIRKHGGELAVSNYLEGGALLTGWLPA